TAADTEHRRRSATLYAGVAPDGIRRYRITQRQADLYVAAVQFIQFKLERATVELALVALQANAATCFQTKYSGWLDTETQHYAVGLVDLVINAIIGKLEGRIVTAELQPRCMRSRWQRAQCQRCSDSRQSQRKTIVTSSVLAYPRHRFHVHSLSSKGRC